MRRANGYAPPEAAKGVQDGRAAAALFASIRATSRTGFMVGCSAFAVGLSSKNIVPRAGWTVRFWPPRESTSAFFRQMRQLDSLELASGAVAPVSRASWPFLQ